jgi:hypothetical protein
MAKPNPVCKLRTGKLIDTYRGFVKTFNWLTQVAQGLYNSEDLKVTEEGDTVKVTVNTEITARYV